MGHSLFGNQPTEVWIACFANISNTDNNNNNNNISPIVLSGGDDMKCKIWDIRCCCSDTSSSSSNSSTNNNIQVPLKPIYIINDFNAGVTMISPNPNNEYIIAIGSYDESLSIYDLRCFNTTTSSSSSSNNNKPKLLYKYNDCGGGIWRIKWHQYNDEKLLLAVMYNGSQIIQLPHGTTSSSSMEETEDLLSSSSLQVNNNNNNNNNIISKHFTKHESITYGADWFVQTYNYNKNNHYYYEAAATCSFYDRAACIWDSTTTSNSSSSSTTTTTTGA
jgi:diphthamide biosynthesis protein 7